MPETPQQMDIARWAGVSAVGSPRWPNHRLIIAGSKSSILLLNPTGTYFEVTVKATTVVSATSLPTYNPDNRLWEVSVLGAPEVPNAALWVRADKATWLSLYRESDGALMDLAVSTAGNLSAVAGAAINDRQVDITRKGPELANAPGRVVVWGAPGKPTGFILQDTNGKPWVTWVDGIGTLRTTDWPTFLEGLLVATGATAGKPGTFTPAGSAPRANLAAMSGITASPATAWTTGQYVVLGDNSHAHWTSTAWAAGDAP